MAYNNLAALTQSHKAIAAKKKARREQIKEVVFDDEARREFLTGFHKRKLAKADAARTKAKEREKQERQEARREQRRMLREQALENAAQVEQAYGALADDGDWKGIHDPEEQGAERDEEYEDEEMLATVTVVEDFDPDTFIHGPTPSAEEEARKNRPSSTSDSKLTAPKPKTTASTIKKKPRDKKIRYQTKDDRKVERSKQYARRTEKAELAGGKASRKKTTHGARRKAAKASKR
ncbi:nucleolar protein 12-domain-containing protein [Crucibulum laeve]|uniref:Nucleolar protein 12-domain-containing protein n=1 Tax=Crucibulum laeve TaxID=68775 RepID=A0A5C3MK96_9AGAR|nr:nucleolar protein 12-domain-containing protein [Crucibulum laeve]